MKSKLLSLLLFQSIYTLAFSQTVMEPQADYLVEVWSHTDDKTPKKIVGLMEDLMGDIKKRTNNNSLKIQLEAIKSLHDKFQDQIPGIGGDQPSVCEWKDMLASVISGIASDSEIAVYEGIAGVTIGTGTEKSRRNIAGILETAQKTKGVYDAVVVEHYMLTGSTAGFGTSGAVGSTLNKAQGAMDTYNKAKEIINKIPKACKEGHDIKDIQHTARTN